MNNANILDPSPLTGSSWTISTGLRGLLARPKAGERVITRVEITPQWVYATVRHTGGGRTYLWDRGRHQFALEQQRQLKVTLREDTETFSIRLLTRQARQKLIPIITSTATQEPTVTRGAQ